MKTSCGAPLPKPPEGFDLSRHFQHMPHTLAESSSVQMAAEAISKADQEEEQQMVTLPLPTPLWESSVIILKWLRHSLKKRESLVGYPDLRSFWYFTWDYQWINCINKTKHNLKEHFDPESIKGKSLKKLEPGVAVKLIIKWHTVLINRLPIILI